MSNNPLRVNIVLNDNTVKQINVSPGAWELINRFASPVGFGFFSNDVKAITRSDCEDFHQLSSPERQAIFRLGQMDMREAVCDLLRDEAKKVPRPDGFRIYELIDKIEQLEVLHADA